MKVLPVTCSFVHFFIYAPHSSVAVSMSELQVLKRAAMELEILD